MLDRRQFLRDAALATAGVLASLGLARTALALPVRVAALSSSDHLCRYAVPTADGIQIDRDNEVILVRWQNAVYAFSLGCPHQNVSLRWNEKDHRFQCPKHHSQYQPDGAFIEGRATRGMDRFDIRREGEELVVDLDHLHKQSDDASAWTAAVVKLV
jgi:nitrite reductase/ring-hydroxylating ferredoxin subunit